MNNADMPAMPAARESDVEIYDGYPDGLTKREYFAGLALNGLCSSIGSESARQFMINRSNQDGVAAKSAVARVAVKYADAILEELEATK